MSEYRDTDTEVIIRKLREIIEILNSIVEKMP